MSAILRILAFILLGAVLVAALAGAVAYALRLLNLYPPNTLTIAAGAPGSAYHDRALAYREVLARDDISLRILETAGSVANAALLASDDGADIALVQGGVPIGSDIEGLAAVQLEPLWLFASVAVSEDPAGWAGLRIAAGAEGSGSRLVADRLIDITGVAGLSANVAQTAGGAAAARALLSGGVDLALFVAPPDAPYLQPLFAAPSVRFFSLAHSEAIALRLPEARLVRMPSGILDYQRPLPPDDISLVALVTRLVARDNLHPALINRLIHAVKEVHGKGNVIPANRQYPSAADLGITVNAYAAQLFEDGFSPLERLLPYWIVAQLNRVLLVLLPAIFLLLPLLRLLPALYQTMLRRRVFKHYARIHELDSMLMKEGETLPPEELESFLAGLKAELDDIEKQLLSTNLPNSYRKQAYTLLHHVEYVRRRSAELAVKRGTATGVAFSE